MDAGKYVMWHLYQRGRVWWARRTVDGAKERRSTGHRDKRLAEAVVLTWHRGDIDPTTRSASTTLKSALAAYIDDRRVRGRAAGTLKMHTEKAAAILSVMGEDVTLDHVTAATVDALTAARLSAGASRSTIGKELSTLRGALRLARRRGLYHLEHGQVMPIGWSDDYEPRTRHLSPTELPQLLAELAPQRAAHVAFIVATGVRWGESLRAERDDVDLAQWELRVRGTKTKRSRATIPVSPGCRGMLALAVERTPQKGPMFAPWANVRRDLAVACARAKIAPVTPNDLRRTTASWLVQSGVDLFAVSRVLRHADTRMVERVYGQVPSAALRTMLERARPANDPRPSATVPVLCLTGRLSGAQSDRSDEARCGNLVPGDRIELSTRGFSNRGPAEVRCRKSRRARERSAAAVPLLCLARPTETAGPVWAALHLAKAAAMAGDRAGALAALRDAVGAS